MALRPVPLRSTPLPPRGMATSSSASATERARFFFAAALLLVMLLAAPKPRRGRALGHPVALGPARPRAWRRPPFGRGPAGRCSWPALPATGTTGTR
ncbi:hypothetical protein MUK42_25546 [Musa troglodytarum]|uniref:Uncharacterized protein n=1 Tax=Musa troglodytarum TaxID=320322 RepID=A0A9E7HKL6_9LILI|nr:hypothetical protein MUK42_25546 [Musa troglodytarum]